MLKYKFILVLILLSFFCNAQERFSVVCDENYYLSLMKLIQGSKKEICIVGLYMGSRKDRVRIQGIMGALKSAKSRGVQIRVFLEGDRGIIGRKNQKTIAVLSQLGIKAKADSKNIITHTKLVIVDRKKVLIGSTNLSENSMKNNHESNLLIASEEAGSFYREYFDRLWKKPHLPQQLYKVGQNKKSVYFTDGKFFEVFMDAIGGAKKEIRLVTYLMKYDSRNPKHPVTRLLKRLVEAHKRGVKIKIILEQSYRGSFNYHIHRFNRYSASFLRRNGIKNIVFDSAKKITHSKILLIDGKVIIGSANCYDKGLLKHHQTGVITLNPEAVKGMKEYFDGMYKKYSGK